MPSTSRNWFGDLCATLCQLTGKSPETVSRDAGVAVSLVRQYVEGSKRGDPEAETLFKFERLLGCPGKLFDLARDATYARAVSTARVFMPGFSNQATVERRAPDPIDVETDELIARVRATQGFDNQLDLMRAVNATVLAAPTGTDPAHQHETAQSGQHVERGSPHDWHAPPGETRTADPPLVSAIHDSIRLGDDIPHLARRAGVDAVALGRAAAGDGGALSSADRAAVMAKRIFPATKK